MRQFRALVMFGTLTHDPMGRQRQQACFVVECGWKTLRSNLQQAINWLTVNKESIGYRNTTNVRRYVVPVADYCTGKMGHTTPATTHKTGFLILGCDKRTIIGHHETAESALAALEN